jgi:acylphosphatase
MSAPAQLVIRKRVVAHGRVQGVFFRDTTRRRAESIGVSGWVRNRDDGSVEAAFEGESEAVESMVAFCRAGPGRSEVERLEVFEEEPEGASGFQIR